MEALLTELGQWVGGEVKMFRQHRDTRFSRDQLERYREHVAGESGARA